jgi:hypothetical protein
MPVYQDSPSLYTNLERLFASLQSEDPQTVGALARSRLAIRIRCSDPAALVVINGRTNPVDIQFGKDGLRPDLDIELPADALHEILMGNLSLKMALASGAMRVRGPVWKTSALEGIFQRGKLLYPQIYRQKAT